MCKNIKELISYRISEKTYKEIVENTGAVNFETGGIIGNKKRLISYYYWDEGVCQKYCCVYMPNVSKLNDVIKEWSSKDISFVGIFHSHFNNIETLSTADIKYIEEILKSMPFSQRKLLFPIVVLPKKKIIFYEAHFFINKVFIKKINVICHEEEKQ